MNLPTLSHYKTFADFRLALIDHVDCSHINTELTSMDMTILEWAFDSMNGEYDEVKAFFDHSLDRIDCTGCHAPQGLIYKHDIAAKVAHWHGEIDDVLTSYHDDTDEHFEVCTVGALVWFAVEYRANELASLLRNEWRIES